jgi:hypothetical protein
MIYVSTDSGATWTARALSAPWGCVASSADGTKLVAGVLLGQIYTTGPDSATTAVGASGCLIGGPNTAIELQYIGNNQFLPLSHEGTISAY